MGRKFSDIELQAHIESSPYEVVEKDGMPFIKVQVNGAVELVTPEKITSMILEKLKVMAENYYDGRHVANAVISVPASFGDVQKQAIRDAATEVGLNALRFVAEPVLAGMAHGIRNDDCQTDSELVLILNLGERRYDAALVDVFCGVFEILETTSRGYFSHEDLSNQPRDFPVEISDDVLASTRKTLKKAKVREPELSSILLVGSPNLVSQLTSFLSSGFPSTPILNNSVVPPELAIVRGAALQADILAQADYIC
jgi:molecular chaperone DnaK (HSP70)